ncbi:MAG: LysM peptidoglycan-binding domain-containing protein [Candidatus Nealsonbacteria bacterium]|nr:LysM peptidoglycan-binding domain-containing protein [Candidatus Nealsonbacteria bacterium]
MRLALLLTILIVPVAFKPGMMPKPIIEKGLFCLEIASKALGGTDQSKVCLEKQQKTLSEVFLDPLKRALPESPELILVGEGSIRASSPPTTFSYQVLGALVGGLEIEEDKKAIIEYIVEDGETLSSIATRFNISLNTVLLANNLTKSTQIKPGVSLIILPVTGIIYHVKSGDTISVIAEKYKGKTDEIVAINSLPEEGDIYTGDILIIPNGVIPAAPVYVASQSIPVASSYFICPVVSPCRKTQGLHWYNAVDFSHGQCGELIYAAAAGTVLNVKLTNSTSRGAFGGAGNTITILHPNGVVTSYGHIAVSLVTPGQSVSQGQPIALMGGKPGTAGAGLSTGCHVHFGVSGAVNPFR